MTLSPQEVPLTSSPHPPTLSLLPACPGALSVLSPPCLPLACCTPLGPPHPPLAGTGQVQLQCPAVQLAPSALLQRTCHPLLAKPLVHLIPVLPDLAGPLAQFPTLEGQEHGHLILAVKPCPRVGGIVCLAVTLRGHMHVAQCRGSRSCDLETSPWMSLCTAGRGSARSSSHV